MIYRYWLAIALGSLCLAVAVFLSTEPALSLYEEKLQAFYQVQNAALDVDRDVKVVWISPNDVRNLVGGNAERIPRDYHGRLVRDLKRAGARQIVFDVQFNQPQPPGDEVFKKALAESDPMPVAILLGKPDVETSDPSDVDTFVPSVVVPQNPPPWVTVGQAEAPGRGDYASAIIPVFTDKVSHQAYENLAIVAFRHYYKIREPLSVVDESHFRVGKNLFQTNLDGDYVINWPRSIKEIKATPYSEVYRKLESGQAGDEYRDKVVFVGTSDHEVHTVTPAGSDYGTWVVVAAFQSLVNSSLDHITTVPLALNGIWGGLLIFSVAFGMTLRSRFRRTCIALAALSLAALVPVVAMKYLHLRLESLAIFSGVVATVLGASLIRGIYPRGYPFPIGIAIDGTVMIVDIRDSTPLVSSLGPNRSRKVLERTLEPCRRLIESHGGEVVNDLGDGLLAFFEARPGYSHAVEALHSLEAIQKAEAGFVDLLGEGHSFTFGVESGPVSRGASGIHGLTIHIASRLQSACGAKGESALIGPVAYGLTRGSASLELLGALQLKGLSKMDVYKLGSNSLSEG